MSATSDITVIDGEAAPAPAVASPLDLPAEVFRAGLDRRRENRAALMDWIRSALVESVDYGSIHIVSKRKCQLGPRCKNPSHFSKPVLFKPGAEKICGMLGVTVHFPTLNDYEQAALTGVKLHHIIVRCELADASGRVVAEGIGARSIEQDYGDINKALKMAEKSAHVDATLRLAGLSEIFTQDLDDMAAGDDAISTATQTPTAAPRQTISDAQRKRLEARISELGLDRERVKDWVRRATIGTVEHFRDLSPNQYAALDERLTDWAQEVTT